MESSSSFLFLLRVAGEKILSTPSHPRHGWLAPQWDLATAKPPCLPACTTLVLGWWIWRSRGGFEGHMGRSRNYGRRYGEIKQPPGKPRGRRLQNRGWRSRGGERSNCGRLTTPPPKADHFLSAASALALLFFIPSQPSTSYPIRAFDFVEVPCSAAAAVVRESSSVFGHSSRRALAAAAVQAGGGVSACALDCFVCCKIAVAAANTRPRLPASNAPSRSTGTVMPPTGGLCRAVS